MKSGKIKTRNMGIVKFEQFSSIDELIRVNDSRPEMTSSSFDDMRRRGKVRRNWHGVNSFEEAVSLAKIGYQPVVEKLKEGLKSTLKGDGRRVQFYNDVVGFAPVVPNAIMGLPNSMVNQRMTKIKNKVIDVYWNVTCSSRINTTQMENAGCKLLSNLIELESQGYRFNIYIVHTFMEKWREGQLMSVKVKDSNTPLDLKRISFAIAHPAMLRVIGFDWYSRFPQGNYLTAYGMPLVINYSDKEIEEAFKEVFGDKAVTFSAQSIIERGGEEHIKNVILGGNK